MAVQNTLESYKFIAKFGGEKMRESGRLFHHHNVPPFPHQFSFYQALASFYYLCMIQQTL